MVVVAKPPGVICTAPEAFTMAGVEWYPGDKRFAYFLRSADGEAVQVGERRGRRLYCKTAPIPRRHRK